jgi:hypothetical protein
MFRYFILLLIVLSKDAQSFLSPRTTIIAPRPISGTATNRAVIHHMIVQPDWITTATTATTHLSSVWIDAASSANSLSAVLSSSSNLLAFSDQGQNLAGMFFQASLLPYLLFLYFISFRANRISDLGNFGFQFVLVFVLSTIPSGIISKSVYGYSLADTDWLHGGAESLLTIANILIVSEG